MFLGCDFTQAAWLLKTVAIELKVTAAHQQMSQLASLINVLVIDKDSHRAERPLSSGAQLTHTFKTDAGQLQKKNKKKTCNYWKLRYLENLQYVVHVGPCLGHRTEWTNFLKSSDFSSPWRLVLRCTQNISKLYIMYLFRI